MNQDLLKAMEANGNQGPGVGTYIFAIVFALFYLAVMWKVFTKAGKPGWASLIPIYSTIVLLQIAGKPAWWFILLFIPIVGLIFLIITFVGLAERFGKGGGFAVGLILLGAVFFPILAFGSAQYQPALAKA
jgi:hypothetical protein